MKRTVIIALALAALGLGTLSFAGTADTKDSSGCGSPCGCVRQQENAKPSTASWAPRPHDPTVDDGR